MKVSVLIPTYNRDKFIAKAIDSVLEQSFDDYEIIIVDDGSTDDTSHVLERYAGKIKYLRTENKGLAGARNSCLKMASGDYICQLDDDDMYYPFKLQLQAKYLDDHPDIGMVYSDFSAFSDSGFFDECHLKTYHKSAYKTGLQYDDIFNKKEILGSQFNVDKWKDIEAYSGNIFNRYLFNTIVFTNSIMFRREILDDIGLQNPKYRMFHDLEFVLRLCRNNVVSFLNIPTYKLQYHQDQVSTTNNPKGEEIRIKKQRDLLRVFRDYAVKDKAYYENNKPKVDKHYAGLCRAIAIPLMTYSRRSPHSDRAYPKRARAYFRECKRYSEPQHYLYAISFFPHFIRRVFFKFYTLFNKMIS